MRIPWTIIAVLVTLLSIAEVVDALMMCQRDKSECQEDFARGKTQFHDCYVNTSLSTAEPSHIGSCKELAVTDPGKFNLSICECWPCTLTEQCVSKELNETKEQLNSSMEMLSKELKEMKEQLNSSMEMLSKELNETEKQLRKELNAKLRGLKRLILGLGLPALVGLVILVIVLSVYFCKKCSKKPSDTKGDEDQPLMAKKKQALDEMKAEAATIFHDAANKIGKFIGDWLELHGGASPNTSSEPGNSRAQQKTSKPAVANPFPDVPSDDRATNPDDDSNSK